MSATQLEKAIALLNSHKKQLEKNVKITKPGTSLNNVIDFVNKSQELGLNLKGAFTITFLFENKEASIDTLMEAGIADAHNGSIGSMFRNTHLNFKDIINSRNSGDKSIGKLFSLNSEGERVARILLNTLMPNEAE